MTARTLGAAAKDRAALSSRAAGNFLSGAPPVQVQTDFHLADSLLMLLEYVISFSDAQKGSFYDVLEKLDRESLCYNFTGLFLLIKASLPEKYV